MQNLNENEIMPMMQVFPTGCLGKQNPEFIKQAMDKIRTKDTVDKDSEVFVFFFNFKIISKFDKNDFLLFIFLLLFYDLLFEKEGIEI